MDHAEQRSSTMLCPITSSFSLESYTLHATVHHHPLPRRRRGHDIIKSLSRPAQADLLASLHAAQRYRSVEARGSSGAAEAWVAQSERDEQVWAAEAARIKPQRVIMSTMVRVRSRSNLCAKIRGRTRFGSSGGLTICAACAQLIWDCSALVCWGRLIRCVLLLRRASALLN